MSAHTPGPWHANIRGVYGFPATLTPNISINPVILGRPMNVSLAKIPRQGDESEANARLIAAAPDLLEALVGMLSIINDSDGVSGYHLNGDIAVWGEFPEVDAARAAIAKAAREKGGA